MPSIHLVLADDHPIVLAGLADLFNADGTFQVLETAADGPTALRVIRARHPDIAILDIRMPGMTGLEVAREVVREGLRTKIVLLTAEIDDDETLEAIRVGVHGVILKHMATRLLVQCLHKVHAGGRWVEQESLRRAVEQLLRREVAPPPPETSLTMSELRVVELLARGARNKEIADGLRVSESTVKNHLHNIYVKLKVSSRRELMRWYQAYGGGPAAREHEA